MGTMQPDNLNSDTSGVLTSGYYGDSGDSVDRWYGWIRSANGGIVTLGSTADAPITNPSTNGSLISYTRGMLTKLGNGLPGTFTTGGGVRVGVVDALPAGNNNIGDVDIASLPPLPAGGNLIGDVRSRAYKASLVAKTAGVISATGNGADLDTSLFRRGLLAVNVTALTGANFDLYWSVKEGSVYYRVKKLTDTAISAIGTYCFELPQLGSIGRVEWVLNSGTSWNMVATAVLEA